MSGWRRPRPVDQLMVDQRFSYQMGRLVGAAEMAGQLLTTQDNPDVQKIGANLTAVVGWFFEDGAEASTKVLPRSTA
jgi:hypothetical protein